MGDNYAGCDESGTYTGGYPGGIPDESPAAAPDGEGERPCNRCGVRGEPSVALNGGYCNDCAVAPAGIRARLQELLRENAALRARITEGDAERDCFEKAMQEWHGLWDVAQKENSARRREVRRLERDLADERRAYDALQQVATTAQSRLSTLEGENARLREALRLAATLIADFEQHSDPRFARLSAQLAEALNG